MDLFDAVENRNPKNRYWRSVIGQQNGGTWTAALPVHDTRKPLFAFANVLYDSGICLSSNLVTVIPNDLGKARATENSTERIDDFSEGFDVWVTRSPATDPVPPVPSFLRLTEGPGGLPGITVTRAIPILTHKIGDPRWRGPEGASLRFRVFVRAPRTLRVVLHENEFAPGWTQYAREWQGIPQDGWQSVHLKASDFMTEKGERLKGWKNIDMLELDSKGGPGEEPIFGEFRWDRGE